MLCSLNRHSKINNLETTWPSVFLPLCPSWTWITYKKGVQCNDFMHIYILAQDHWGKFSTIQCIIFFEKLNNLRYKKFLLVHPSSCVGQTFSSSARPAHSSPPFAGGGFVQLLVLFLIPCRQYLGSVHAVQDEYADHPPFTAPNSTNASICKGKSCNIN